MSNRIGGMGVIALVTLCAHAAAQTTSWQNPATGSWLDPPNWSAGVPSAGSVAAIDNGGRAQVGAGGAGAANVLVGAGATGLLDLSNGSLSIGSMLIARSPGSAGTFTLTGGQLLAAGTLSNAVGNAGAGWWGQSAGDVILQNNLNIGSASSGVGTLQISGGSLHARAMSVGVFGTGTVLHSGGTVTVADGPLGIFTLATVGGATGYYRVSGTALLTAPELRIGRASAATFEQTGGTVQATRIIVGMESGSAGRYVMSGGTLISGGGGLAIGSFNARGSFEQFGGVVRGGVGLLSDLPGADAAATYDLHDGSIELGDFGIGLASSGSGAAVFRQHGGVVRGSLLSSTVQVVGDGTNRTRYEIHGGELQAALIRIGEDGTTPPRVAAWQQTAGAVNCGSIDIGNGSWEQSGGVTQVARIRVGVDANSQAHLSLTGGSLNAGSILVGEQGGLFSTNGSLTVGAATVTVGRLHVGDIVNSAASSFQITDAAASVAVRQDLRFGSRARFQAVPGATIHLSGASLDNRATDAAEMAGLNNLTLRFSGEVATIDELEVASRNLGPVLSGFDQNFAINELSVNGLQYGVRLVDAFDNLADGAVNEHLYVGHLSIDAHCIFDLNGKTVYYQTASIDPSATIFFGGGGRLVAVPEPGGPIVAAIAGLLATARFNRKQVLKQDDWMDQAVPF